MINNISIDKDNILQSPLFYNPNILIGTQSIFSKTWYNAGICYIGDIFKNNISLLNLEEFNINFAINSNSLTFLGITRAIKNYLKRADISISQLNPLERPVRPNQIKTLFKDNSGAKSIYELLNNNYSQPACVQKWQEKLNIEINNREWKNIFPFNITNDTKIQWFQYRIIHRILGTNDLLFKFGIKSSPECFFCKSGVETIEHLFYECRIVKRFLKQLQLPHFLFQLLNKRTILFGIPEPNYIGANILIIFIKMYIFYCQQNKQMPSINIGKKFIGIKYMILQEAAEVTETSASFNLHWSNIDNFIASCK
jgi:hypothetical protein